MEKRKKVRLYTDGACSGNPGKGGWSAIIIYEGIEKEISGYEPYATNNRMELRAAVEGLKALKQPCEVELYSDSSYLVNAFENGWLENWKANGWRKNGKEDISNRDLWETLDQLASVHNIKWRKVKGHGDDEFNRRCDRLAAGEIRKHADDVPPEANGRDETAKMPEREQTAMMTYEEKTVSVKHVYKGNIINVELATVILPDGRTATRDIVRHPGASAIIPLNANGEMYMVRQYRKPLDAISLEIPAGKLDHGEDPLICAKRELVEETGLMADLMTHVASIHSTPGFSDEVLHIYAATGLKQGKSCADADEFISTEKYKVEELIDMVMSGKITDAKSIIGIFLADRIIAGKINVRYR